MVCSPIALIDKLVTEHLLVGTKNVRKWDVLRLADTLNGS